MIKPKKWIFIVLFLSSCSNASERNCIDLELDGAEVENFLNGLPSIFNIKNFGETKADADFYILKHQEGSGGDAIVFRSENPSDYRSTLVHYIFEEDYDLSSAIPIEIQHKVDISTLGVGDFFCSSYIRTKFEQLDYFGVFNWGKDKLVVIRTNRREDLFFGLERLHTGLRK